ncbi:hypothetical protein GCM10027022_04160 [Alpinimonas psychrophila]
MSERMLTQTETRRTLVADLDSAGKNFSVGSPLNEGEHMAIADIKLETPSATVGGGEEGGCCGGACCGGK